MKLNDLTEIEKAVILGKATEPPFTGEYIRNKRMGTYLCRQCNQPLYRSEHKFPSHCGWPSFDDEIPNAVKRVPDADGLRTEIVCSHCDGHLGHIFEGEGFTPKNVRHCVNSVSLQFVPEEKPHNQKAYFASGCFWGTEYFFMQTPGVEHTATGFMGGHLANPTYQNVCEGNTGHLEVVEVVFDTQRTDYESLVKLFFETHDFTQTNGQGPDIGEQYLSCIFFTDERQCRIAEKYIRILEQKGYKVATKLLPASEFWQAEAYHQQYYLHKGAKPYCHTYRKIF